MKRDYKITAEELSGVMTDIFSEYCKEVAGTTNGKIKDAAKLAKDMLREISPVDESSPTGGDYARSWDLTDMDKKNKALSGFVIEGKVVYSKAPHYRLAHLLENGHKLWQGGNSPAIPHISIAEDAASDYLATALPAALQGVD